MRSAEIEKRVAVLEEELASLRRTIEGSKNTNSWWERITGTFENDSIYKQAMKLGREYRQSLKPDKASRKHK